VNLVLGFGDITLLPKNGKLDGPSSYALTEARDIIYKARVNPTTMHDIDKQFLKLA
jgi:hypothetical protein